jgi:hypothetical protein
MFALALIGAVIAGLFLGAVMPDNFDAETILDIDLWRRDA